MTDKQLQKDVLAELEWEPSVKAAHIGVAVENGIVTLSGHVSSFMGKHAAEVATRRVNACTQLFRRFCQLEWRSSIIPA